MCKFSITTHLAHIYEALARRFEVQLHFGLNDAASLGPLRF